MKLALFACMIAVAANHMVAAAPPPVAGGPNCVFPSQSDFRCNAMERVDDATQAAMRAELAAHMAHVVVLVANGDVAGFESAFFSDTKYVMDDRVSIGWGEVEPFLRDNISGGKTLVQSNIEWLILSDRHAVMSGGDWNLDGATGKFIFEDWYRQDDGSWKRLYVKVTSD